MPLEKVLNGQVRASGIALPQYIMNYRKTVAKCVWLNVYAEGQPNGRSLRSDRDTVRLHNPINSL